MKYLLEIEDEAEWLEFKVLCQQKKSNCAKEFRKYISATVTKARTIKASQIVKMYDEIKNGNLNFKGDPA